MKKNSYFICLFLIVPAFAISICHLFLTHYYNINAESIGIISLLRIIDGLPHISTAGELPSNFSPYGAFFYYFFGIPFKFLGLKSLTFITLIARFFTLAILISIPFIAKKYFLVNNFEQDLESNKSWSWIFTSLFIISFPFMSFMIRSDWAAFFLEFIGLGLIWNQERNPEETHIKKIIFAGLLLGLAPIFKLNSVGIVFGIGLYYLLVKRWKVLITLIVTIGVTALIGISISYVIFGKNYLLQVIHSANFGILPISTWFSLLSRIIIDMILIVSPMWIIMTKGYLNFKGPSGQKKLILYAILTNFFIASLFQLKEGAGNNYFLSTFICSVFLFPFGLEKFHFNISKVKDKMVILCLLTIIFRAIYVSINIAGFTYNNVFNYPDSKLKEYLQSEFKDGYFYTPNPGLAVKLYPRILIGAWDERILKNTNYYRENFLRVISEKLKNEKIVAAIIPGSQCHRWTSKGSFVEDKFPRDQIKMHKIGKYCVYSLAEPN